MLSPELNDKIKQVYEDLDKQGEIFSKSQIDQLTKTFRDRFSPEILNSIDGETLLDTIHNHSNPDSLVYWLEFKNDDEFPTPKFGSIAGGSALKFGIYRRRETGAWTTGSPTKQRELNLEDALTVARKHRDQFTRAVQVLEQHPEDYSDANYWKLQEKMNLVAPDVGNTAWGHKYFCLMLPEKLDFFHVSEYQRFHLIKLLQKPPVQEGRYVCAGRYLAIARELDIHIHNLSRILWYMNERPHKYWRIGTTLDEKSIWELMRDNRCVAVGWDKIGDLSNYEYKKDHKEKLRTAVKEQYPSTPQAIGYQTQQLFNFVTAINEGDYVIPSNGENVLGIGKIDGGYSYVTGSETPHRRTVEWLSFEPWKIHAKEGLQTTVFEIKRFDNLVEIERRVFDASIIGKVSKPVSPEKFTGIPGRIQSVLERKGQVILYGPPGAGKTYWAEKAAKHLASQHRFKRLYEELSEEESAIITGNMIDSLGLVRMCTFHPAYGYEDFIEGYRPKTTNDKMVFELRDGILKRLCQDAINDLGNKYFLVIDEINRGDIPRIFGELLTIIEKDKRGNAILLSCSGTPFYLPDNVFIIGTMNTADRSIALLDTALRRRFGFIELMPDYSIFGDAVVEGIPLGPWLKSLNSNICEHIGRDARNLQIGHSYLFDGGKPINSYRQLIKVVQDDIFPLIEEYCYEDYVTISKIIGKSFVDIENQRIRHELFQPAMKDDFIQALKSIDPTLDSTSVAVRSDAETPDEEDEGTAEVDNNTPNYDNAD